MRKESLVHRIRYLPYRCLSRTLVSSVSDSLRLCSRDNGNMEFRWVEIVCKLKEFLIGCGKSELVNVGRRPMRFIWNDRIGSFLFNWNSVFLSINVTWKNYAFINNTYQLSLVIIEDEWENKSALMIACSDPFSFLFFFRHGKEEKVWHLTFIDKCHNTRTNG